MSPEERNELYPEFNDDDIDALRSALDLKVPLFFPTLQSLGWTPVIIYSLISYKLEHVYLRILSFIIHMYIIVYIYL